MSLKAASGWNQSLAQCAQSEREGFEKTVREAALLSHIDSAGDMTLCLHLLTSVTKLSTALSNLLTKNAFLYDDGKCLSVSQIRISWILSNFLTYT